MIEFGLSCAIGAQYCRSRRFTAESVQRYRNHLTTLLTHPNSPWVRLPWTAYSPIEEASTEAGTRDGQTDTA